MPLVWKELEVAQGPSRSGEGSPGWFRKLDYPGNTEFKFIRGRPRKKRKTKSDDIGVTASHEGCFRVDIGHPEPMLLESPSTYIDAMHSGTHSPYDELDTAYCKFLILTGFRQHLCSIYLMSK
jgi:hypothetical protein